MEKVYIHDSMIEQINRDKVHFKRVFGELIQLARAERCDSLAEYLKKRNAKKMAGVDNGVWKFRLTKGDRILYTLGKNINGMRKECADAVVLLGYSKHENQERDARRFNPGDGRVSVGISEYISAESESVPAPEEAELAEEIANLDFFSRHKLFCVDDVQLSEMDIRDADVYLSDEQRNTVENFIYETKPTLVLGGAGTGKTMIALHIINDYDFLNDGNKVAYFTQSYELRKSAERRYSIISDNENTAVTFNDVNEFALELLGKEPSEMKKLVDEKVFTKHFPDWMKKNVRGRLFSEIDSLDFVSVWTEIRGIIKGQLNSDWTRYTPVLQDETGDEKLLGTLIENRWVKRCDYDKRRIIPCKSASHFAKRLKAEREKLSQEEYKILRKLSARYNTVDTDAADIGKETYLSLSDEDSTLPVEKRELYWSIYEEYCKWLRKNGLFDENDLARTALKEQQNKKVLFDLIAVDEAQDYTEMQLYFIYTLSRNKTGILYAGDGNQNVNPTLFRTSHLKTLFEKAPLPLEVEILHRDYRCPGNVVETANNLADFRVEKIARQHEEEENVLECIGEFGPKPYRLEYSRENLECEIRTLAKYPASVMLVPDGITKEKVLKIAGEMESLPHLPLVHTIPEIKGMEYRYVFCYNMVGEYIDRWKAIVSKDHRRKQTAERFYFNLLYVAMTRTQMCLGFCDDESVQELEDVLDLERISEFDEVLLHFKYLTEDPEEWLRAAVSYEDNGNYEDAKRLYLRIGAEDCIIRRCDANILRLEHRYADAFKMSLFSGDEALMRECTKYLDGDDKISPVAFAMFQPERCHFSENRKTENMREYLENEFSGFTESEKSQITKRTLTAVRESLNGQISILERWIDNNG